MRRIVMWFMSTVTAVVLLFGYHTSTAGSNAASTAAKPVISSTPSTAAPGTSTAGTSPPGTSTPGTSTSGTPTPGSSTAGSGAGARATTVTGPSVDTRWGPVQVAVTTSGGQVTSVRVLDYPSGNSTDAQINSYALPVLVQETMDQQSAQIDMVSGATVTSGGYIESLQAALDKAGL
jgi:uncharacterized protein with FMN-binding domain